MLSPVHFQVHVESRVFEHKPEIRRLHSNEPCLYKPIEDVDKGLFPKGLLAHAYHKKLVYLSLPIVQPAFLHFRGLHQQKREQLGICVPIVLDAGRIS